MAFVLLSGMICLGMFVFTTLGIEHLLTMDSLKTIAISTKHLLATYKGNWMFAITLKNRLFPGDLPNDTNLTNKNVVVFVHGRNGHPNHWNTTITNIMDITNSTTKNGNNIILLGDDKYYLRTMYLGPTDNTSISNDALVLYDYLQMYKNCNVTLIGISKGGVVAMAYKILYDKNIKVITISSPLKGTKIASLFHPSSITYQSLSYENNVSKTIINGITDYSNIYHIVPKYDHLIIPTSSAYYDDTPKENIYFHDDDYYSHASIQFDVKVAKRLVEFIGHKPK